MTHPNAAVKEDYGPQRRFLRTLDTRSIRSVSELEAALVDFACRIVPQLWSPASTISASLAKEFLCSIKQESVSLSATTTSCKERNDVKGILAQACALLVALSICCDDMEGVANSLSAVIEYCTRTDHITFADEVLHATKELEVHMAQRLHGNRKTDVTHWSLVDLMSFVVFVYAAFFDEEKLASLCSSCRASAFLVAGEERGGVEVAAMIVALDVKNLSYWFREQPASILALQAVALFAQEQWRRSFQRDAIANSFRPVPTTTEANYALPKELEDKLFTFSQWPLH